VIAMQNHKSSDVASFAVSWHCGTAPAGGTQTKDPAVPLSPGHYEISVELVVDKTTVTLPLGHLDADPHGAMRLAP